MKSEMEIRRLYFAHGQRKYGTPEEANAIQAIAEKFPNAEVVNPKDHPPARTVIASGLVQKFLKQDYCGNCQSAECKMSHFLNLLLAAQTVVIWKDDSGCGTACEERFANFTGLSKYYYERGIVCRKNSKKR